jgi:hypothetical protein
MDWQPCSYRPPRSARLSALALLPVLFPALALFGCNGDDGESAGSTSGVTAPTTGFTSTESGSTGDTDTTVSGGESESNSDATTDPTTTDGTESDSDSTTTGGACEAGEITCDGSTAQVCDGEGGITSEEACDSACAPGLGCVECVPGSGQCDGEVSQVCNDDGSAYVDAQLCDPLQGLACDDGGSGLCLGSCAVLGSASYIGCDYYPVVTPQLDNFIDDNPYAVAVANTADQTATVTVTRGDEELMMVDVAANSVELLTLPWVDDLVLGNGPSTVAIEGAYRLRSTQPVTVYQFNPLDATTTNDSSLLFPVNTWGMDYMAASWGHWNSYPAWYAVVASQDGTTVDLSPSATGMSIQAGAGVASNGTGQVTLDEGDVLQVISSGNDITGTIVNADKPVAMLAGHDCTNIPHNITACDHLEDSMFPIDGLGKEYIVVPPVQVPNNNLDKAQMIKIIASEPDTTLTFEPDQPVNKTLTNAGDFVQISMSQAAFKVSSDKKILVAQFMVGQSAGFGTSDPAMVLAVPTDQYRDNYLFFAATNWVANFVDIIAPTGTSVEVDQQAVNSWSPIGNTGYSVGHVNLSNAGDGTHRVTADQKVGISVYGVQSAGSYWFPGGLDLDVLPQ